MSELKKDLPRMRWYDRLALGAIALVCTVTLGSAIPWAARMVRLVASIEVQARANSESAKANTAAVKALSDIVRHHVSEDGHPVMIERVKSIQRELDQIKVSVDDIDRKTDQILMEVRK